MVHNIEEINNKRMGDLENCKAISYLGLRDTDLWVNVIVGTVDETVINNLPVATFNGLEPCQ